MTDIDVDDPWVKIARLKARLAEVEAERDAALLQRDGSNAIRHGITEENRALAAENARLRPVVEAVDHHTRHYPEIERMEPGTAHRAIVAIAHAYRAAQNSPASPSESTLGDEQGEPAVASTNTAQAQAGGQGARWKLVSHNLPPGTPHTFDEHTGELSWAQNVTADPPGLDAAIEAAVRAAYDYSIGSLGLDEDDLTDVELGIGAAVRAAAPALRAGALRAEADSLLDEIRLQSSWLWYELGETAIEKLAKRLRERADRIGGAT